MKKKISKKIAQEGQPTLKIIYKDGSKKEIEVLRYKAVDHFVDLLPLITEYSTWLIEKKHTFQQTQLMLTGINPSLFIGFDKDGKLVSKSKFLGCQKAPASLMSTAQWLLVLPLGDLNTVMHVEALQIKPETYKMEYPDRHWNIHWLWRMQNDPSWRDTRFKLLNTSYPPFSIPEERYDIVDKEEFIRFEADRLPLFVGSQFGVSPWYPGSEQSVPFSLYAILGKSLLSGHVAGIRIFVGGEGQIKCIANFRN